MTTLDDFAAEHEDAAHLLDAQRRQILELEATVAFLEAQNVAGKAECEDLRGHLAACRDASPCGADTPYWAEAIASPDCVPDYVRASFSALQTDLGAASFIAGERTRNSIVRWLRETIDRRQKPAFERDDGIRDVAYEIANAIANCEDIEVI